MSQLQGGCHGFKVGVIEGEFGKGVGTPKPLPVWRSVDFAPENFFIYDVLKF